MIARSRPAPVTGDDPRRMNEVLEVAARLFNARGYRQTSLTEVAAELGMNKASLYHYVRSKEELLQRLMYRAAQPLRDLARDPVLATLAPAAALERMVREHCRVILAHRDEYGTLIRQRPHIAPEALAPIASRERAYANALRRVIERVAASGRACPDPALATQLTLDAVNSILRWFRPRGRLSQTQVIDQVWLYVAGAVGIAVKVPRQSLAEAA